MEGKMAEESKFKGSKGGSKTSSLMDGVGSAQNGKGNRARVSSIGKEGLCGDNLGDGVVKVVKTKVVETEIEVKNGGDSVSVQEAVSLVDSENELASDSIDSDLDDDEDEDNVDDGVSLLADISTEMEKMDEKDSGNFGQRENFGSLNKNRENPDQDNCRDDGEEEDFIDGEYEFCVGDFVWGKIKSHPWWPGQVYDPSNASDYALKVKHRDRLLVAYFDGTFAWCHPYQLKPFVENFEELSKQSTSKNFVNAVQKAVDEIGRLVELKMTCSCVPKERLLGLARPMAANSGIKQGVLMPEGGIAKLWTYLFGPEECLSELKRVAQFGSTTNILEFTELKCWLSAFYRAKGGYLLALYHEPQPIPGLEDNNQNKALDKIRDENSAEGPIQGPVVEESNISLLRKCLPEDPGNGQYQRRKQKSIAEIMERGPDSLGEDVVKEIPGSGNPETSSGKRKRKGNDEASGGTNSSSKPKRRKVTKLLESTLVTASVERDDVKDREERKGFLLSMEKKKSKDSSTGNDGSGNKEDSNASPMSIKKKTIQRDGVSEDQIEKGFLSRERKKSKYLSPPYTSINKKQSKKDIEAEFLKISSEARVGERMSKAANLIGSGSIPILSGSNEMVQKKHSEDVGPGHETSDNSSPETPKLDQKTVIDAKKVKVAINKVLSGIRSIAIDLDSLKNNKSLDLVEEFLSTFRSSVYCDGSNYEIYNKSQPGRKRKTLDSEPGSTAKRQNQIDQQTTPQKKFKKKEEEKSDMAEQKQAATTPGMKTSDKETDGKAKSLKSKQVAKLQDNKRENKEADVEAALVKNANSKESDQKAPPASLFVTFGPGAMLPSKRDLIKIYSKFGSLNEEETEMFYHNFSARIVFLRSSDAEAALKSSKATSPFGKSNVKFRLKHSTSPSNNRKHKEVSNVESLSAKEGSKTQEKKSASKPSDDEASPFDYIKQKLEMIASVLGNSDGKMSPDLKSKLEVEVNGILRKVNSVMGSSSA